MRSPKECSHAYILMTLTPLMISLMILIRLSVLFAVFVLSLTKTFPIHSERKKLTQLAFTCLIKGRITLYAGKEESQQKSGQSRWSNVKPGYVYNAYQLQQTSPGVVDKEHHSITSASIIGQDIDYLPYTTLS